MASMTILMALFGQMMAAMWFYMGMLVEVPAQARSMAVPLRPLAQV